MKAWNTALKLFLFYVRIGFFTFGGGWSIIAQMQREFVEHEKIITEEELLDITSVGRSLPGTMIGNVSFLLGYHLGGFWCGIAALSGITVCPFIVLCIITMAYTQLLDSSIAMKAMIGIRAAVVPIMLNATLPMWKQAMKDKICYIMMSGALVLCIFKINNILVVIVGAVAGLLWKERIYDRNS